MRLARDEATGRSDGFASSRRAEVSYARQLRRIARHIADIVRGLAPDGEVTPETDRHITDMLNRYSETLDPWAQSVATRMVEDVDRRDAKAWTAHSVRIGRALRREVDTAPTGAALRARLAEQVTLIKSLPIDAARRVHELALTGLVEGRRPAEIAAEVMRTGDVSKSRAELIAATEVSRTASLLTQVRAQSIGSVAYTWATSQDASVRPSHRKMQGQIIRWDDPPTIDGMVGHAGCFPRCRCWPRPILLD